MTSSERVDSGSGDSDDTSPVLIRRIKAGDPAGWEMLVNLYSPLVLSWCQRSGLNGEDSADVLQEVFAAVARKIADFRRERPDDTFRGWLRVIARNQIRLFYRKRRKQLAGGGDGNLQECMEQIPDPFDEASEIHEREVDDAFRRVLESTRNDFHERTWQAFWRTVVDGQPTADVAKLLHMSVDAVRQARHRILERLRGKLAPAPTDGT